MHTSLLRPNITLLPHPPLQFHFKSYRLLSTIDGNTESVHFYYSCLRTLLLQLYAYTFITAVCVHFYYSCMRTLLLQLFAYIFIKLMRTLLLQLYAYTFITTVCRTFLLQLFLRNNCQLNFCV